MVTYKTIVVPTDGSENAKRALEHALAVAGVKVKSVFEVGSPGPALLAVAKKYNADLIVMGSRGLGPLKGLFMGSVSSYVTSHSTCPVLIIK
ncbi:MAG: universal stress protein [Veillonella sp.]|nr:universal stress protein [Veillonella sp.]